MSGISVQTEIRIARPKDVVAQYSANPDNTPEWYENIKTVQWQSPRPLSVGTKLKFTARFLRRELSYIYEVILYKPNENLVMRTLEGPFPMETTYEWKSIDINSTLMILRNVGRPAGFSTLFKPVLVLAVRHANQKDLRRLKRILESR